MREGISADARLPCNQEMLELCVTQPLEQHQGSIAWPTISVPVLLNSQNLRYFRTDRWGNFSWSMSHNVSRTNKYQPTANTVINCNTLPTDGFYNSFSCSLCHWSCDSSLVEQPLQMLSWWPWHLPLRYCNGNLLLLSCINDDRNDFWMVMKASSISVFSQSEFSTFRKKNKRQTKKLKEKNGIRN